jgi:hypothetical protein
MRTLLFCGSQAETRPSQASGNEVPVLAAVDRALSSDYGADVQHNSNPERVEYFSTLGYGPDANALIGIAGANGRQPAHSRSSC